MTFREYEPTDNDPLIRDFLKKFGGGFAFEVPAGEVFYEDDDGEWFHTPETKTQFFDMVSQSLKNNSNLFLDHPYIDDLPEGAVL